MRQLDLSDLESWVSPIVDRLSTGQRKKLNRTLAIGLRRRQQQRIRAQKNPDGSGFEKRQVQRSPKRRIQQKAAMFLKLRDRRYLKIYADSNQAEVGFNGRAARIAAISQYGEIAQVSRDGPLHKYAQRQILGITDADQAWVMDQLKKHLLGA